MDGVVYEKTISFLREKAYVLKVYIMLEIIIWVSAIIRIVICFLPQNNWCSDEGNLKLSIIRNATSLDMRVYLWRDEFSLYVDGELIENQ